jgi:RHS repeat-associated protein
VIVNPKYATQERERAPETAKAAFCDEVSGLRYYNPTQGRWLNRDLVGERGGDNLYGAIHNDLIAYIDAWGLAPESTQYPGPFAGGSIPIGPGLNFTPEERAANNANGDLYGCHLCGAPIPGTASGNWILDHMPPRGNNPDDLPFQGYPSCASCSFPKQANETRAAAKYPNIDDSRLSQLGESGDDTAALIGVGAVVLTLDNITTAINDITVDHAYSSALADCSRQRGNGKAGCGCCEIQLYRYWQEGARGPDWFQRNILGIKVGSGPSGGSWLLRGTGFYHSGPCAEGQDDGPSLFDTIDGHLTAERPIRIRF